VHKLLLRQIRRHFGAEENVPGALRSFLEAVSRTYEQADTDRELLDHSMHTVSQELISRNARLREVVLERSKHDQALLDQQAFLRQVIDLNPNLIFVKDEEGRFGLVNRALADLYDCSVEEMLGRTDAELNPNVEETDHFRRDDLEVMTTGRPKFIAEEPITDARTGARRYLETTKIPLGPIGTPARRVLGVATDVTQRRELQEARERANAELLRTTSLVRATFESAADGILVVDLEGRIVDWNQKFVAMWGIPDEIVRAHDDARLLELILGQITHPAQFLDKLRELEVLLEDESFDELELLDGRIVERYSVPQRIDGRSVGRVWNFRDVTQRKEAERRLLHDAFHDGLTCLPNRARFTDLVGRCIERAHRSVDYSFAVLFLDIDRFKVVNDSLGHSVGDELLVAIARRLEACVRPGDTVARLGGDEFTILVDGIGGMSEATSIATRLIAELRRPFVLSAREVFTSTSIGIALSRSQYEHADELLRDADLAMYRAKISGKSCYAVFDVAMHTRAMSVLQLETDLRHSLDRRDFVVRYQPMVSVKAGVIVGFEALVRWQHPERGLVSPDEFLAVAEESGLIVPLGAFVLREACAQLRRWQDSHPRDVPLTMSVNLSARQFVQRDLVEEVAAAITESGIASGSLRLEITEHVIIENTGTALTLFEELRALGVRLDLDDFGTGYSSLSSLHQLDVDALKIDRSFVQDIGEASERTEIVGAVLALAGSLGMEAIAEGVETVAQLETLRALGCNLVQGYLFGEALTRDAATALLALGLPGHEIRQVEVVP
jgi:diguanylate cyclase (GGDEF)-like protein/PAS domain S-box-containing protein